ncbi:hypothetical protein F4604DRAFT_1990630 [Suillus subluteus]|nr:hypothetical protein F4604DRAFT_1990630 [Suillus subluteus]
MLPEAAGASNAHAYWHGHGCGMDFLHPPMILLQEAQQDSLILYLSLHCQHATSQQAALLAAQQAKPSLTVARGTTLPDRWRCIIDHSKCNWSQLQRILCITRILVHSMSKYSTAGTYNGVYSCPSCFLPLWFTRNPPTGSPHRPLPGPESARAKPPFPVTPLFLSSPPATQVAMVVKESSEVSTGTTQFIHDYQKCDLEDAIDPDDIFDTIVPLNQNFLFYVSVNQKSHLRGKDVKTPITVLSLCNTAPRLMDSEGNENNHSTRSPSSAPHGLSATEAVDDRPILFSDPSLLVCPDFMGARYQATRTAMVTPTVTEAQAAETLRTTWVLTNEDLCLQWQDQVTEDERLNAERKRAVEEEAERERLTLQLEENSARADEKKKNRSKHSAIIMRPRPFANDEEALVSEFVLRKIDSGKYVELYYWTNDGLDDALVNYRTRDDDSMVPSIGEDGSTVWVSAATSKPAAGVIADRDLTPVDFAQAIPRIMAAIEERDWTKQRVQMLAQFWGAIMLHRYWNSKDQLASRTILLYQEEQHRAWHSAILSSSSSWDLSIIDEPTLLRTFERVYCASLIRTTNVAPDVQSGNR